MTHVQLVVELTRVAAFTALTCASGLTVALAQDASRAPVTFRFRCVSSIDGKTQYRDYFCAECHGEDGKGKGPRAAGLGLAPSDLTTIAQRNGGHFNKAAVEASITRWDRVNMDKLAAGNTSEIMPLYGPLFFKCYPSIPDRNMHLANLVDYLKKLQEKQDGSRDD